MLDTQHQCCFGGSINSNILPILAFCGDTQSIRSELSKGADPDSYHPLCGSALYAAAIGGQTDTVRLLNRYEIDVSAEGYHGNALAAAAYRGHKRVVEVLLNHGVSVNDGTRPMRALLSASARGHEDVVRLLVGQCDIDVNAENLIGQTALVLAGQNDHHGVALILAGHVNTRVDTGDLNHYTAMTWAAVRGWADVARMLLAKPDIDQNLGPVALGAAANAGHADVLRLLLTRDDIDPNASMFFGQTPLALAIEAGHTNTLQELLEDNRVNPNIGGINGPPLWIAARSLRSDMVRRLLCRADVNPNTRFPYNALEAAVIANDVHSVQHLLAHKDIDPSFFFF